MENYVIAQPEKLWSKLAVEKILRPHVLSTVAAGYAKTEEGLYAFFGRTFYAHQYGPRMIKGKIGEVLKFLADQEMVEMDGRELVATKFGKRVSELYIDPMSAVIIRDGLYNRAKKMTDFSLLHLISKTPDIAPRPRPRGSELDKLGVLAASHSDEFMGEVANQFEDPIAYDEFLSGLKSIDDIKERSLTELTSIPTIGPSLAKRIKEQAGGLIKADEWEKAKSTKSTDAEQQQVVLTDYEDTE